MEEVPALDADYGLSRGKREPGFWVVTVIRQAVKVTRTFHDEVYGDRMAAYHSACAFAHAVADIVPPLTNKDIALRKSTRNRSGIPGVFRSERRNGALWTASLGGKSRNFRRKSFSVKRYGEAGAKEMAMAQRETWLAEMDIHFTTRNDTAGLRAQAVYPHALADVTAMNRAEIEARVQALHAQFDALRPRWLRVTARVNPSSVNGTRIDLRCSDEGSPPRVRKTAPAFGHQRGLAGALEMLRAKAASFIVEIYDEAICAAFMARHANAFSEAHFSIENGFSLRERVDHLVSGV